MKLGKVLIAVFLYINVFAQTPKRYAVPDTLYTPEIGQSSYALGEGPMVYIDEAHYNYHTMTIATKGRFIPFARLLERDGYQVQPNRDKFSESALVGADILVVSNALHESDSSNWAKPNPSAFDSAEIQAVYSWVKKGGSLLLIADHQPFPGSAAELGKAFGFEFVNEWVVDTVDNNFKLKRKPITFRSSDNTLTDHVIRQGRSQDKAVDSLTTFTGQAFKCDECEPLLVFGKGPRSFQVEHPREIDEKTISFSAEGWLQGAAKKVGKGRVVVFGEAAAFSAQTIKEKGKKDRYAGMNRKIAALNYQYLLNVFHWLTGRIE